MPVRHLIHRCQLPLCLQSALARCVMFCLTLLVGLQGWHAYRVYQIGPVPHSPPRYLIDLNTATWEELMQVPRMGETMARRIVAERTRGGPFAAHSELTRVRGIGPATITRLGPYLANHPPHAISPTATPSR